ncbi:MAG TPA: TonB family protein [Thermoanaerobaculia bacterium]
MADSQTRHTRGLLVVIFLGVVFFTLLALVILKSGGREDGDAPRESETLTVLPLRIRIRTEPHARAAVVATAQNGEKLLLLEDRGSWVRVQTSDKLEGWAERANLERTGERDRRMARYKTIRQLPPLEGVATDRVQLYAGPGIFYPLVGDLADGTNVKVYTRDHDFYALEYRGQVAYADVELIDLSASGTHQFDVATSSAEPPLTGTTPPASTGVAETATVAPPPVEPVPEPTPEPEPAREEPVSRVYAAVPPGGTQPEEVDRIVPRYPAAARRAGVAGSVVVRGIVRRDGTMDNVEIIKDLGYGLGESVRDAVRRWRFRPATYQGDAIDVYYTVTVNFRLR